ncbi:MAG: hypothetical protein GIS02_01935 [Methanosarcinales archaeon]|uniref:Uncharacterized protein n=1 Tax=Candidatus Ethanoperedens thermophilum TaxID=2766897 RepID=A0A848D7X0_9EURY|nr:hypothetical protein [Candidatus Ethanoperedens thermophilum]
MNMKKFVAIGIVCLFLAVMPAMAQENNTTTNGNETNATLTPPLPSFEPTEVPTAEPTTELTTEPAEAKFRVGPTVRLRPVNDVIDKSQDGLIELYMNNPALNDVTLIADVQVNVPSGIHVYGEGFGYGAAAGTVAGKFEVPPGTVRTIHINIKSEKVGDFTVHFTGLYWPDGDKDAFQQISLTHPFTVKEPSPMPMDEELTGGDEAKGSESEKMELPYTYIIIGCLAVIAIAFIALVIRKPPKTEVTVEE